MMYDFELTSQEYRAVIDALEFAEEKSISAKEGARFSVTMGEMVNQFEEQDGHKSTESER